ncbi:MAG: ABC transporter ATP-binding protein, partial [Eubacteriales bacterium]|nr:ABC transporter ATP-binding protein [Eubacteriales bacterium]
MKSLLPFLKPYRKELFIGPLFKWVEAFFELLVPLVVARLIDVGVKNGDASYVWRQGGIMVLLGLVGLCSSLCCQYMASKASQGFGTDLRGAIFRKVMSFSGAELDYFTAPSLVTRLTGDSYQVQQGVAMLIRMAVRAPFLVVGAVVMAMTIDMQLSLVFICVTPVLALIIWFVLFKNVPRYREVNKKLDRVSTITRENLLGARVVRAFSKEEEQERKLEAAAKEHERLSVGIGKLNALLSPLTSAVMNLGIAAIIWFGAGNVDTGSLTQGELIAFVNYMGQILLALIALVNLVLIFIKAAASGRRICEVLDTTPEVDSGRGESAEAADGIPAIEMRGVSMRYGRSGDNALDDISISVPRGETLGVIGGTGSGKSTLAGLIPRMYDVSGGEVLVNGLDVRAWDAEKLRQRIGLVPQSPTILSGTILSNVTLKKPDASEEDIKAAIEISQSADFVYSGENGIMREITAGGRNLSGGQRQRLTIARAIAAKPEILILDDSASALDMRTDKALRHALRERTRGMTEIGRA